MNFFKNLFKHGVIREPSHAFKEMSSTGEPIYLTSANDGGSDSKLLNFYTGVKADTSYTFRVLQDAFTGEKSCIVTGAANFGWPGIRAYALSNDYVPMILGVGFSGEQFFVTATAYQKHMKFNVGDSFDILLKNGDVHSFKFESKAERYSRDQDGIEIQNRILFSNELFNSLIENPVHKWQYKPLKAGSKFQGMIEGSELPKFTMMCEMLEIIRTTDINFYR